MFSLARHPQSESGNWGGQWSHRMKRPRPLFCHPGELRRRIQDIRSPCLLSGWLRRSHPAHLPRPTVSPRRGAFGAEPPPSLRGRMNPLSSCRPGLWGALLLRGAFSPLLSRPCAALTSAGIKQDKGAPLACQDLALHLGKLPRWLLGIKVGKKQAGSLWDLRVQRGGQDGGNPKSWGNRRAF